MAISLITSFVGTALNLQGAAKQRAIAAKAQREADIATQKSLKAIEKSGIVDIALPTKQYEMLTRQIEQQTRQATEAAREAGPRGVAQIPKIQAAGVEAFQGLQSAQEEALFNIEKYAQDKESAADLATAEVQLMQAEGAQVAAAEARAAENQLNTSALNLGMDFLGGLTKFNPDDPDSLYGGGLFSGLFGGANLFASSGNSIDITSSRLTDSLLNRAQQNIFGETTLPELDFSSSFFNTPSMGGREERERMNLLGLSYGNKPKGG